MSTPSTSALTTVSVKPLTFPTTTKAVQTTSTQSKPSVNLDKVQQGVNIFQDLFNTFQKTPSASAPTVVASGPAPQTKGIELGTVLKWAVGLTAGTMLAVVVGKALRKKKKGVDGLSGHSTSKKTKRRKKQRAAVAAKSKKIRSKKVYI